MATRLVTMTLITLGVLVSELFNGVTGVGVFTAMLTPSVTYSNLSKGVGNNSCNGKSACEYSSGDIGSCTWYVLRWGWISLFLSTCQSHSFDFTSVKATETMNAITMWRVRASYLIQQGSIVVGLSRFCLITNLSTPFLFIYRSIQCYLCSDRECLQEDGHID